MYGVGHHLKDLSGIVGPVHRVTCRDIFSVKRRERGIIGGSPATVDQELGKLVKK